MKILALVIIILTSFQATAEDKALLKLGIIQSQSGFAQADGIGFLEGMLLALSEINAKEKQIEYLIEDDNTLPKNTVSAYKRLKAAGVDAVMGPSWSFLLDSIEAFGPKDKTIIFNTSNYVELIDLSKSQDYVLTNAIPVITERLPYKKFIQKKNVKSVAILKNASSWAEKQAEYYTSLIKENGVKVVLEETASSYGDNEWREIVPRVIKKQADTVLMFLNKNDLEAALKRFLESGFRGSYFSTTHTPEAFEFSNNKQVFEGLCFTYPKDILNPNSPFVKKFKAHYNKMPGLYADTSYDGIYMIWEAFEHAKKNNQTLLESLKALEYKGYATNYKFRDGLTFATGEAALVCIENEKYKIY